MYADDNCTYPAILESCTGVDCNTYSTPISCNVGFDNEGSYTTANV